jgi:hypothetical protein
MLVTLVAILCNGQLCLDKVVTNSEQSGITMSACQVGAQMVLPSGSPMVRITTGSYKVISASWADTLPRTGHDARATLGSRSRLVASDATGNDELDAPLFDAMNRARIPPDHVRTDDHGARPVAASRSVKSSGSLAHAGDE